MRKSLFVLGLLLSLSVTTWAKYTSGDYTTYTLEDATVHLTLPADKTYTVDGTDYPLDVSQGMAVGKRYAYVAKEKSDKVCMIYRIDLETGLYDIMNYYESATASSNTQYTQNFGHANELEIVEHADGTADLFVSTLKRTSGNDLPEVRVPAIIRLKVEGTNMKFVACYEAKVGTGFVTVSAMKYIKTNDKDMYFLVKRGTKFYAATIPVSTDGYYVNIQKYGTSGDPIADELVNALKSIPLYQLFDTNTSVTCADGSGTFTENIKTADGEPWSNQGFGYNPTKKLIYVPIWRNSTVVNKDEEKSRSVILTYDVSDQIYDESGQINNTKWSGQSQNTPTKLSPTKTTFWLKDMPEKTLFEVESASFRTGTTDKLYFNTNESEGDKIYEVVLEQPATDAYTVRYDPNGGTGTKAEHTQYASQTFTITNDGFTHDNGQYSTQYQINGWYAHRESGDMWLYAVPSAGRATPIYGWYKMGEQPSEAYFARVTELSSPIVKSGDVITLYPFWEPYESTNNKCYHIRYNGNGGKTSDGKVMMGDSHHITGTASSTDANLFKRPGYTFIGWSAFRYAGAHADETNQWAFVQADPTNNKQSAEGWYSTPPSSTNYILKTYKDNSQVEATTNIHDNVVVFYAQWARVVGTTMPDAVIEKGTTFDVKGKLQCTSDMWGARVRIEGYKANGEWGELETRTTRLHSTRTSIDPDYADGYDLSQISEVGTIISGLPVGRYTYEIVTLQLAETARNEIVVSQPIEIVESANFMTTQIPTKHTDAAGNELGKVELANPTYGTLDQGEPTVNNGNYEFNTVKNHWYEFTDPQSVGYKFVGWESLYVTNNQHLLGFADADGKQKNLLFSQTKPIQIGTMTNVKDKNHAINYDKGIAGENLDGLTKNIIVNVWAKMTNWTNYTSKMRILSCSDGGGWNIGSNSSGQFQVHNGTDYKNLTMNTDMTSLSGWHMFTLTFSNGQARGYIDAGAEKKVDLANNNSGASYKGQIGLLVGGEIGSNNGLQTNFSKFDGEVRNVVITKIWPTGSTFDTRKTEIIKEKLFDNSYVTYLYTGMSDAEMSSNTYTFQPVWEANNATQFALTANVLKNANGTENSISGTAPQILIADGTSLSTGAASAAKLGGTGVEITPRYPDHIFLRWDDNTEGHRYVSNRQGIEYKKNETDVVDIFTRKDGGEGETDVVTFDGKTHYFVADQSYKYTDCITVNVWAHMDDWEDFTKNNMRLFSCTQGGGFNIERKAEDTKYIDFVGYDKEMADWQKASTYMSTDKGVTWASLNEDDDKWHMFTYVFDGQYIRGYIDGECVAISERFRGKELGLGKSTDANHANDNHIVIGGEATKSAYGVEEGNTEYKSSSNTATVEGYQKQHFVGQMKNFAIMHTALASSQVKDLYENPREMRFYHSNEVAHTTGAAPLTAVWKKIDDLAAQSNPIHVIAGDETVEHAIDITGNTVDDTQLTLPTDNKNFTFGDESTLSITVPVKDAQTKIWYTPNPEYTEWDGAVTSDNPNKSTITFTLSATNSTTKTGTITAINHRFDIAYWNREGFAVQLDEKDADFLDCEITVTPKDKSALKLSGKISGTKRTDNTYFIPLSNETINKGLDLSLLSDQEVAIHIEHKDANGNVDWTIDSKRWVPKYITSADGFTSIENPDRDVVIAGDVVLNADLTTTDATTGKPNKLGDVYVQPDASFTLGEGGALKADALVIYSGFTGGEDIQVDYSPSISLPSDGGTFELVNKEPTIYYVKRLNKNANRWYTFSLPYDCFVSDIKFTDGNGEVYDYKNNPNDYTAYSIYIQEFDGRYRAANTTLEDNWQYIDITRTTENPNPKLYAGRGYAITMDEDHPKTLVDVVFPMHLSGDKANSTNATINLHELDNRKFEVSVAADEVDPKKNVGYYGWNLLGSPYLGHYAHNPAEGSLHKKGQLNAGEAVEVDEQGLAYLTVPMGGASTATYQTVYRHHAIPPFGIFFVQAAKNGTMQFVPEKATSSQSIVARKKSAVESLKRTYVGVTLSNASYTDETALVVGNQFTQAYEIGSDLQKMLGTDVYPQVYINDASNRYAFKSLSVADAAGTNKLGVYLPTNGEYTFAVNENYDLSGIQTVHLTDYQEGVTVDLLDSPYTFTSGAVHTTSRFALSAVLSADVATDLTSGTAIAWAVWQDAPLHVQVQGVTAGDQIRVYDSMGHLILQTVATDTTVAFALPAEGAYCIQTVGAQGSQVKKMMVK